MRAWASLKAARARSRGVVVAVVMVGTQGQFRSSWVTVRGLRDFENDPPDPRVAITKQSMSRGGHPWALPGMLRAVVRRAGRAERPRGDGCNFLKSSPSSPGIDNKAKRVTQSSSPGALR